MRPVTGEYVGRRLARVVKAKGWSFAQTAIHFEVSEMAVRNWLSDRRRMSRPYLPKLTRLERAAAKRKAKCDG